MAQLCRGPACCDRCVFVHTTALQTKPRTIQQRNRTVHLVHRIGGRLHKKIVVLGFPRERSKEMFCRVGTETSKLFDTPVIHQRASQVRFNNTHCCQCSRGQFELCTFISQSSSHAGFATAAKQSRWKRFRSRQASPLDATLGHLWAPRASGRGTRNSGSLRFCPLAFVCVPGDASGRSLFCDS